MNSPSEPPTDWLVPIDVPWQVPALNHQVYIGGHLTLQGTAVPAEFGLALTQAEGPGPTVPEPAGHGLVGLMILAVRRRRK